MAHSPKILIITGYGLNCEAESKYAWEQAGARPELVHLHDLMETPSRLMDYGALMFIGGFSFGDHMSSGHVLALRLRHRMRDQLARFIEAGRLVLGVCNGFQTMVKLGLLPGLDGDYFTQRLALAANDCGMFQNFWVRVRFEPSSPCVFTRGLELMDMPVRHGEGKVFTADRSLLARLEAEGCVACRYVERSSNEPTMKFPDNPNGSLNAIAGLCDPTGRVFGLMPHPEAFLYSQNHPQWDFQIQVGPIPDRGQGLRLFENGVAFLR